MYLVDIRNLVRNKSSICKEYHIQPSEIDRMQFFEYEFLIEDINKDTKEAAERQKEQEKAQQAQMGTMPNYNQMMSNARSSMPKMSMPSMPKF